MEIVWILGILGALLAVGVLISRRRESAMNAMAAPTMTTRERRALRRSDRARRRAESGAYAGGWGYGGADGGGYGGGGFDGGGCGGGGDGGGGGC